MAATAMETLAASGPAEALGPPGLPEPPRPPPDSAGPRPDEAAPALSREEVASRLATTARELRNRRKLVVRHLPPDYTTQDVHELLRGYEIKYCYLDRTRGTAFVTLLDGQQAQDAISCLHGTAPPPSASQSERLAAAATTTAADNNNNNDNNDNLLRHAPGARLGARAALSVNLQPTDSLLCVANLPPSMSRERFLGLCRQYGAVERCLLVYSRSTGHSKAVRGRGEVPLGVQQKHWAQQAEALGTARWVG
ncbi:ribonucleoprotein PTB-binding 1-like [Petromyzon marinus]|uniref:ribonucleoprotein PTB-binding 1-like n=1 Tax=Petromyzon marinus TaxID=7757 RepID=UPI003F720BBB